MSAWLCHESCVKPCPISDETGVEASTIHLLEINERERRNLCEKICSRKVERERRKFYKTSAEKN